MSRMHIVNCEYSRFSHRFWVHEGPCSHQAATTCAKNREGQAEERFGSLWASVKAFQQRIRNFKPEHTTRCSKSYITTCSPRPLAAPLHVKAAANKLLVFGASSPRTKRARIPPSTARKMSANAAMIGAVMMLSVRGLMAQLTTSTDFMEIACAPTSSLSTHMEEMGWRQCEANQLQGRL